MNKKNCYTNCNAAKQGGSVGTLSNICYEGSAKYIGVITSSAEVFVLGLDHFAHVYMPKIAISTHI